MKKLSLLLLLLMVLLTKAQAQNSEQLFTITIDSVRVTPTLNPEVLYCYTTIKNLSKETIEFRTPSMFKKDQEERMWNLIIKKDGRDLCTWVIKHDVDIFLGNFTINKGNIKKQRIPLLLDEMVVDSNDGVGSYSIQINVTNVEPKKLLKKQTVTSNTVNFLIGTPIKEYRLK